MLKDGLDRNKTKSSFRMLKAPDHPHRAKIKKADLYEALELGIESIDAIDTFENWIRRMGIGTDKNGNPRKIIPLVYSHMETLFLRNWLKDDYDRLFFHERSLCATAQFLNDKAGLRSTETPFPKFSFSYLCVTMKVARERPIAVLTDCLAMAETYKRMTRI